MNFIKGFFAGCFVALAAIVLLVVFDVVRTYEYVCSDLVLLLLLCIVLCVGVVFGVAFHLVSWLMKK